MPYKISILVPIYNEEGNIKNFYLDLKKMLLKLNFPYEIIFVNDGSNDNSSILLDKIKTEDTNVTIINHDKRYGQLNTYITGFDYASGEIIITMDADLQYDPKDLSKFLEKIDAGFDFVSGYRINRKDSFYRKIVSFMVNWLISAKIRIKLHDYGCGFNAFKRDLIFSLRTYKDKKLFLLKPLLVSFADSVGELGVEHYPRWKGNSKYNILSIIKLGLRFLLNFSINQEGKMRKTSIGSILLIVFISILFLLNYLRAEVVDEDKIRKEAISAFISYQISLGIEDYERAFSLEPNFTQRNAGNVETYKTWWSATQEIDEWRTLYSEARIKNIEVLTPKRVTILVDSPDKRMAGSAFYIFPEDGEWKVGSFKHIFHHTKKDLEKLKDIVAQYYEKNKKLPIDLSELISEYIEGLPTDLFNDKDASYRYIKSANENFIIYSFGPDSDDDLGMVEYDYKNGLLSNGDIIIRRK